MTCLYDKRVIESQPTRVSLTKLLLYSIRLNKRRESPSITSYKCDLYSIYLCNKIDC